MTSPFSLPWPLRLWFRACLRLVPAGERAAIGADMEAVFALNVAEERRRRGRLGVATSAAKAAWDIAAFALASRRDRRRQARRWRPPGRSETLMDRLRRLTADIWQDARFSVRLLLRDRGFALTGFLTLAICIGANAALFSVVRSVVLKPLPVPHADRLVAFHNNYPKAGDPRGSTGVPDYDDRRAQTDVFDGLALFRVEGATLGGRSGAVRLRTLRATPSFFRILSAGTTIGRTFTEDEGEIGKEQEVLLSTGLWQREFAGAHDVVGRSLRLSGTSFQIVGVLAADFPFLTGDVDVYLPAAFTAEERSDAVRHSNNWNMIGLLKPGVPLARALAEIDAINRHNDVRFPELRQPLRDAGFYTAVVPLQADLVQDVRPVLLLLWGGGVFVLLIGCLNLTNLVLVRSNGRTRELATRQAIGAGFGRLSRQLLTETTLLAVAGGAAGLFLGQSALHLGPMLGLDVMPRGHEIALDPTGAAIILTAAAGIGALVGVLPLLGVARLDVNGALRDESRGGTASRGTTLVRRALATAEITIAFVLLVGAGLLAASFREALRLDPGFKSAGVLTGFVVLPTSLYADATLQPFADRLLGAMRATPGITAAGFTSTVPLSGDHNDSVVLAEGYRPAPGESITSPNIVTVSDGYFEAMSTPLVRGRYFTRTDDPARPLVVVIDERLANHFWPGHDPLGRRIYLPANPADSLTQGPDTKWLTVVGVVKEVQFDALAVTSSPVGAVYLPAMQSPVRAFGLVARSTLDETSTLTAIRQALAGIDRTLPLFGVRSMDDYVGQALAPRRIPMLLSAAFAAIALLLSAIGIYGVLAYGVAQRRREIGIRLALGSTAREVFGLVLREGLRIVAIGLVIGIVGLAALRRVLTTVLYGVTPFDPLVLVGVTLSLAIVALAATMIPARRAARVSPVSALVE